MLRFFIYPVQLTDLYLKNRINAEQILTSVSLSFDNFALSGRTLQKHKYNQKCDRYLNEFAVEKLTATSIFMSNFPLYLKRFQSAMHYADAVKHRFKDVCYKSHTLAR